MSRLLKLSILAFMAALIAAPAMARHPTQWVLLGEQRVGLLDEGDVIAVGEGEGPFLSVKVNVSGNDVDIRLLRIRFLNGDEQTVRLDGVIRAGHESPVIDLQGERRGIREILLRYNGRPLFGGRAKVAIWAEKVSAPPPPPPPSARLDVIDRQSVDAASDRIVFKVGREDGRLSQIAIRAVDTPLTFRNIQVTFGNGETQNIDVIERLEPGQESRIFDLEGEARVVEQVVIQKRPSWRPGASRAELLAKRRPAPPPPPPSARLDVIDRQSVDAASDRIVFKVGREDGRLSQIAIRAVDTPLTFRNIQVTFGNGETQNIDVIERLEPGQESRIFDLEGEARVVEQVVIQKRPSWRPGASRAELLAKRRPAPPPPPPSARLDVIDRQSVDAASDRIVFKVGREDGRLSQIAIRAVDTPLTFRNIQVTFGNGETQNIDVIERLEPGQESRIFDLEGEARVVEQVVIQKRPSWRPGASRAELLARRRPAPPPPRPAPSAGGYDIVDSQIVDKRSDRVVFRVPRGEGPFTKIKFHAVDDSILFRHIQIVFTNGETQDLDVLERLEPNEESPDIDVVNGERRSIEQVIVTKRPSWRAGESRLQLLGFEPPRRPPPPPPRQSGPPSHGYPPGWVLIGTGSLPRGGAAVAPYSPPWRPNAETDRYRTPAPPAPPGARVTTSVVQVGKDVGLFNRIGLRLLGDPINLKSLTIIYDNGERDRVLVAAPMTNNTRSQPIQLKGDRFIKSVGLEYTSGPGGRSYAEVYGDYADNWLGERGRRRDFNQGWVLLGSQRAQMISNDVDAFQIGERFGRFRAVKITVRQHAVRFYGMRIVYGGGQVEDVRFSGELTDGQSSPALDLKGRERFIDRVELKYRTKLNFLGEGVVEVWGMQ